MLKNTTYKDKIAMLNAWMPHIVETVKKDLKQEHLKNDFRFFKQYFGSKNINKLTTEELAEAYSKALGESDEETAEKLAEFLCNRWLLKNTEIYHHFEETLAKINPNFAEIDHLDKQQSREIIDASVSHFGAAKTYLFSVINSVVFPEDIYEQLGKSAEQDSEKQRKDAEIAIENTSADAMKRSYEAQIARLTDRFEKKILGLEKKYHSDIESLKKQVVNLQRKLNGQ